MHSLDILSLSFKTVRSNKLRTSLTVAIIAFGIMALVGIITAIGAMQQKFTESFASMGANAFSIRFKQRNMQFGNERGGDLTVSKKGQKEKKSNLNKRITKDEAEQFVKAFSFPGTQKSISVFGNRSNIVSYREKKTSPNVTLLGGDESYLELNNYKLAAGRNMSANEVQQASNICILGYDVAKKFFGEAVSQAVGQVVRINNKPFLVLGVLESMGAAFGFSRDNMVIVSYQSMANHFVSNNQSYVIAVKATDINSLNTVMGEAEVLFRGIRKNMVTEASNFVLDKSDSMVEKAMNNIYFLKIAAMVIGFITLVGAAIGLMNIMLVSVAERTKEVGLVKAIGGKSIDVRYQFLLEAIIISVIGALVGIVLGILLGNFATLLLDTAFLIPWDWIVYGIIICTLVGIAAGLYPAIKAGKLSPIEALRYE